MLSKEKLNKIIGKTIENGHLIIRHDYIEGRQWSKPGVLTGTGISTIDKVNPTKTYEGVVLNLIEDALFTMKTLIKGENEDSYTLVTTDNEETNSWFKTINFGEIFEEIVETQLKYGKAYLYLTTTEINGVTTPTFNVLSPKSVYIDKETGYIYYVEVIRQSSISSSAIYKIEEYITQEDGTVLVNVYENTVPKGNYILSTCPFIKLKGDLYLTDSLLHLQDILNIKLTKLFEVEKYNTDPTRFVTGVTAREGQEIEFGSGSLVILPKAEQTLGMLNGQYVDQYFLQELNDLKLDYRKLAKLSSMKNSDLSGVTSGYALQLKLMESLAYVNSYRATLKQELLELFNNLFYTTGITVFKIEEIYFSPIIGEKTKESEAEQMKLDNVQKKVDLLIQLTGAGYTKEEAEKYISDNLI